MSTHGETPDARRPATRPRWSSVVAVGAVCALAAGAGFTAATWVGSDDVGETAVQTGHLDVRVLKNGTDDHDADGVAWYLAEAAAWVPVTTAPLVIPGDTLVAAIPFEVDLEGDNLLADLSLEGAGVADGLKVGKLSYTVVPGAAGAAAWSSSAASVPLNKPFTIELEPASEADSGTYTALLRFEVPKSTTPDDDGLAGLATAIADLDIVLEQTRSAEGGA